MSLTVKKDKLSIPDGTEDVLGIDMRIREHVIKIIKETYEKFGFNPHKTPILEYQKTFDGHHGEGEKLFFKIVDKNNNKIMPRYDLTVPFARVANMHNEIPRPYKRYQIGYSFRDDEPGDSHYREFTQCDADIIGTKSLLAEVDITKMAHQLLNNLGIKNFILRVNHRLLIKSIAKKVGITTKYQQLGLQRALDYVDKISKSCQEEMYHKLTEHSIDTNTSEKIISTIKSLSTKLSSTNKLPNQLVFIENFFNRDPTVLKATNELSYIFSHLPKDILSNIIIDLTLARGADYYTGFILEGIVNNINVGAILGGGRYDNLVSKVGNLDEPAVGLAFGLERLLKVIKTLESINFETCFRPKILLAKKDNKQNICSIADKLRKEFDVDIYYDSFDKNKVLNYAEYNHYPLIVCISSSEIEFHAINGDSSMEDKVKTLCTTLDG